MADEVGDNTQIYESDSWPRFKAFFDGVGVVDTVLVEQVQELEREFAKAQLNACTICTRAKNKQIANITKAHAAKLYALYGLLLEMQKNPGENAELIKEAMAVIDKEITKNE